MILTTSDLSKRSTTSGGSTTCNSFTSISVGGPGAKFGGYQKRADDVRSDLDSKRSNSVCEGESDTQFYSNLDSERSNC